MSKPQWVAAAALSAGVMLTVALGDPRPPLAQAADCLEYQWIGDYALTQDDGWRVEFSAQGQLAQSTPVVATSPTGESQRGTLAGSISGDHINFTVHWDSGWLSNYSGNAAKDNSGFVYGGYLGQDRPDGQTFDRSWDSTVPLGCAKEAGIPPGQLPIPADQPPAPQPTPQPADASVVDQYVEVPDCHTDTQVCAEVPTVKFQAVTDEVIVSFTANQNHCAPIIAHILIDGYEWGFRVVGPGQNDGGQRVAVGPPIPGEHTIGVKAEGIKGGCNTGFIGAWGGTVHIKPVGFGGR